jgi:hypothetical protein
MSILRISFNSFLFSKMTEHEHVGNADFHLSNEGTPKNDHLLYRSLTIRHERDSALSALAPHFQSLTGLILDKDYCKQPCQL